MKKILIIVCLMVFCLSGFSQTSSNIPPRYDVNSTAVFQLFPTENRWIFIKLNTETGQMWMLQYSTSSISDAFTCPLNPNSLLRSYDEKVSGRFTLYPTQNHYNFILLDQISGRTWQVQWSTELAKTGVWEIL